MNRIELNGGSEYVNFELYKAPFRQPIILQLTAVEPAGLEYEQDENGFYTFAVKGTGDHTPTIYFDLLNMDADGGDALWEREIDHLMVLVTNGGRDQVALFFRPEEMTSLYPIQYDEKS